MDGVFLSCLFAGTFPSTQKGPFTLCRCVSVRVPSVIVHQGCRGDVFGRGRGFRPSLLATLFIRFSCKPLLWFLLLMLQGREESICPSLKTRASFIDRELSCFLLWPGQS